MFDKILDVMSRIWEIDLVRFLVFLLVAFVAAGIAKLLVTKLLKLVKLDKKLDKWGVNEGQLGTSMSFVGKLVYLIVFLMFLPSALAAIGITSVSSPIDGFVSTFIDYLPKLIAAGIVLYIGIFVAILLGQIVSVLLRKTKIDNFARRNDENAQPVLLSDVIVKVMMAVIILVTVVQALLLLDIDAISTPALQIVNAIFGAIPSIALAVVVIACGLLVTSIVCTLLANVLVTLGFDSLVKKILPQIKVSATKVVVAIVRTLIIVFVVAQGIEALDLAIFTTIVAAVVSYLPMVIKAAIIAFVAFVGAAMLEAFLVKTNPKATAIAIVAKVAVYTVAGFMILSQLGIATEIVNTAFVLTLAAIAVSFALAFGLGGKDFAKKTLDRVDEKIEQSKKEDQK